MSKNLITLSSSPSVATAATLEAQQNTADPDIIYGSASLVPKFIGSCDIGIDLQRSVEANCACSTGGNVAHTSIDIDDRLSAATSPPVFGLSTIHEDLSGIGAQFIHKD
jgi:hypothetical protein